MTKLVESNNVLLRRATATAQGSRKLTRFLEEKIDLITLSESERIKEILRIVAQLKSIEVGNRKPAKVLASGEVSEVEARSSLIALYASAGLVAREVTLLCDSPYVSCEVWSNLYQKWIYVDPIGGIYATHGGKPLSLFALWMLKRSKQLAEVEFVGDPSFGELLSDRFGALAVSAGKNRFLVLPLDEKEQRIGEGVAYQYVSSPYDIYFTINRVWAGLESRGRDVTISLEHNMPWFARFERQEQGRWMKVGSRFTLEKKGRVELRAVNSKGLWGGTTFFELKS